MPVINFMIDCLVFYTVLAVFQPFNSRLLLFNSRTYLHTIKRPVGGGQWEEDRLYYCDPGLCPCHAREAVGGDYILSFSQDRQGQT